MNINTMMTCAALGAATVMVAPAAQVQSCPVIPMPQSYRVSTDTVDAKEVKTGIRTAESKGGLWDNVPKVAGAYAIKISPEGLVEVLAHDEMGMFYAKQTLSQMLDRVPGSRNAQKDPYPDMNVEQVARLGKLPVGTVIDWPDLKYRGTVEGYYGIPWSYEARRSQFDFYGRNKMNLYIYAPKDDPLHHGKGCYEPYPDSKAFELAALVRHARKNHVRFVWAIHPANTVKWDENGGKEQLQGLCKKLQWMYDLGVRDFGVLVDDSFGEIGKASRQVELCNYILENFIRTHPDVNQELIMCPTGYNRSWANTSELETLGHGLHKDIHVMWTGNTVVNDITFSGQQWVNQHVKRPTFIWWNWPCNDMKPARLSMGRTYGLDQTPGMEKEMSGFVANPMERAEASKVGLFGVAAYTWNIKAFDSHNTWKEGIRRLYPQCAEFMQVFCDHNADLLPNTHGYAREESVEIKEMAQQFRRNLAHGKMDTELLNNMSREFGKIAVAGHKIAHARGMQSLQTEIAPWIRAFALTGEAGEEIIRAMKSDRLQERLSTCLHVVDRFLEMATLYRDAWQDNKVVQIADVQVGSYAVTPALQAAFNYVNAGLLTELTGRDIRAMLPSFSTNVPGDEDSMANVSDGNPSSNWKSSREQKAGDWFCLDMGEPTKVSSICFTSGTRNKEDFPLTGQMEISQDGNTWLPLGNITMGRTVAVDRRDNPIKARMVRYRILQPSPDNSITINEFSINGQLPAKLDNTITGLSGIYIYDDGTAIGLSRKMEVAHANSGSYIRLSLPVPVYGDSFVVNFDDTTIKEWAQLEFTLDDGSVIQPTTELWHEKYLYVSKKNMPKQAIRSIRLLNKSAETKEVRLNSFTLGLPYVAPDTNIYSLTDGTLATAYNCGKAPLKLDLKVPAGATRVTIISTAECSVTNSSKITDVDGLQQFILHQGAKNITIEAPHRHGTRVYEVLFH